MAHTALLAAAPALRPLAGLAVTGLWQGVLLLGAVALLLRALPLASASARAALWAAAFGLAVLVPFLHLSAGAGRGAPASSPMHLGSAAETAIVLLWLVLSTLRAGQLLREAHRLHRLARASAPVAAPADLQSLLRIGRRTLALRSSAAVDSPCVLGFFRPQLLLPAHTKLSPVELHAVVLHEREHLSRHDDWVNLLQRLALVLFPLNPALTLMDRRLGAERELACDAAVVAQTAEPLRYAGILTRLAEQRLHLRSVALALSTWARRSELTRRVETLLRPAAHVSPRRTRFAAATVAATLCAGSAGLARAPQLVTFGDPGLTATPASTSGLPTSASSLPGALPAAFHPAAFHPGSADAPRAVLLRATVSAPARPGNIPFVRPARRQRPVTLAIPQRLRAAVAPGLPLARVSRPVLTRARVAAGQPVAARALVVTNTFSTYAAVPFADGWLVLQL